MHKHTCIPTSPRKKIKGIKKTHKRFFLLRYFKRNLPIAVAAGLTSILTQLSTPVAAMLEQRLVDNIIARDFQGFSNQLLYSGLLGFGFGTALLAERPNPKTVSGPF